MDFHGKEDVRRCDDIRDWQDPTIQSQYSASPVIKALVLQFLFNISPYADLGLFFRKIFDVQTAEGVGLDIWGRIVGVGRQIEVEDTTFLGFLGSRLKPFNNAPLWMGKQTTNLDTLDDKAFRKLIMWKAMANISTADAANINKLLNMLFDGKPVYVLEVEPMHIRFIVEFPLEEWQRATLKQHGLFARGAAVDFDWLEVPVPTFGFAGTGLHPFGQGTLFNGGIVYDEFNL